MVDAPQRRPFVNERLTVAEQRERVESWLAPLNGAMVTRWVALSHALDAADIARRQELERMAALEEERDVVAALVAVAQAADELEEFEGFDVPTGAVVVNRVLFERLTAAGVALEETMKVSDG